MSTRRVWVPVLTALAVAGCSIDAQSELMVPPLDADTYETTVHPYVAARCATLDCHGVADRPLRLYSELGLRRDSSLRTAPSSQDEPATSLTLEEYQHNVAAFSALAVGQAGEQLLVLAKPLAVSQGGVAHKAGPPDLDDSPVWGSEQDPGYLCIEGWITGALSQDGGVASDCSIALEELARLALPSPRP